MNHEASRGITPLVRPRSIALFGCSQASESALPNIPLRLLQTRGYPGKIFPINPKYDEVWGLKCYPSISAIPPEEEIDLAFLLIPFARVPQILEECCQRGVRSVIVGSGGFAEVGGEGLDRQEQIKEIARAAGIRVMGPNCLGLINLPDRVYATFSPVHGLDLSPGKVGIVAHSGSIGLSILNRLVDKGVGVSYFFSSGNEADLDLCDFIEFLLEEPSISVIGAFIECIRNPQRFLGLAERALEVGKPIVALRAGSSERGARTILAHTGALAGSARVYEAAFRGKGILRAESYDDMVGMIEILAKARHLPRGGRLGVITTSGGSAGVMADNCALRGVELAELSNFTREEISRMQSFGTAQNPLDLTGQVGSDPLLFQRCLDLLLGDEAIDTLLLIFTNLFGQLGNGILGRVSEVLEHTEKPLIALLTGGSITDECIQPVSKGPLPLFRGFHECLRSIKAVEDYARFREKWKKRAHEREEIVSPGELAEIRNRLAERKGALTEEESKALLSRYRIPVAREGLARDLGEARRLAAEIGYPVAVKVVSPQILHKTEAQAIQLNVRDEKELEATYPRLLERVRGHHPPAEIRGVLVQEMVADGMEVIVGTSCDPTFGPTVLFGMGGIYAELLRDVSLRLAPVSRQEALEMVREIKGYEILAGARGRPPGDLEAIADTIWRLSRLVQDLGDLVAAIDINPLIVRQEGLGVKGVDALVVLKEGE